MPQSHLQTTIMQLYFVDSSPVLFVVLQHPGPQHVHHLWKLLIHKGRSTNTNTINIKKLRYILHYACSFWVKMCLMSQYSSSATTPLCNKSVCAPVTPTWRFLPLVVQRVPRGRHWWPLSPLTRFLSSSSPHWCC